MITLTVAFDAQGFRTSVVQTPEEVGDLKPLFSARSMSRLCKQIAECVDDAFADREREKAAAP